MTVRLDTDPEPIPGQLDLLELIDPTERYVPGNLDESGAPAAVTRHSWFQPEPQDDEEAEEQWEQLMAGLEPGQRYSFNGWRHVTWERLAGRPSVSVDQQPGADTAGQLYVADLACWHWHQAAAQQKDGPAVCLCVTGWSGYLYSLRCSCDECGPQGGWTRVHTTRAAAIEEHVDVHWPGWRDLPILERRFDEEENFVHVVPDNYPERWRASGSPIRECRGDVPPGLHVPRAEPFGGWAMAVTGRCPDGIHW